MDDFTQAPMMTLISVLAALLPIAIYIFVVYKLDNFSLLSVKRLFMLVLCGMLTAVACFLLFMLTGKVLPESASNSRGRGGRQGHTASHLCPP